MRNCFHNQCARLGAILHSKMYHITKHVYAIRHKHAFSDRLVKVVKPRELHTLARVANNYKCTCSRDAFHFPKVLAQQECFFGMFSVIRMSDCGKTVASLGGKYTRPNDCGEQIACIKRTLRRAGVYHMDPHASNVCVDQNGVLSLIDFDMVYLIGKDDPWSMRNTELKSKYNKKHFGSRLLEDVRHDTDVKHIRNRFKCDETDI